MTALVDALDMCDASRYAQHHVDKPSIQEDTIKMYGGCTDFACYFFSMLR